MTMKISRNTYKMLIEHDIKWLLESTTNSLERMHIIEVLRHSIENKYGKNEQSS